MTGASHSTQEYRRGCNRASRIVLRALDELLVRSGGLSSPIIAYLPLTATNFQRHASSSIQVGLFITYRRPLTLVAQNWLPQARINSEKNCLPASSTDSGFVALAFAINIASKGPSAKSRIVQDWWLGDKIKMMITFVFVLCCCSWIFRSTNKPKDGSRPASRPQTCETRYRHGTRVALLITKQLVSVPVLCPMPRGTPDPGLDSSIHRHIDTRTCIIGFVPPRSRVPAMTSNVWNRTRLLGLHAVG